MKKITWAAFATTLIFGLTQCVVNKKETTTTPKNEHSSVWKISKDGQSIYLGGTVHLLRKEDYPLPAPFNIAYEASDVLVFETDTKKLNDPSIAQQLLKKGMLPEGQTIQTVLNEEAFNLLEIEAAKYELPLSMLQNMKPGMVVTTISAMAMQKMGMNEEGVDMHFTNKAIQAKKEIEQLETVDDQINRIVQMGVGNESEFVTYSLADLKDMESSMAKLIDQWKTGQTSQMNEEIETMQNDYPAMYKSLLVERNYNWMPQIMHYLDKGRKAFILVGSLHLHGRVGLLNLLKEKGYTVTQL
jgi:uncharacterized protein